LVSAVVICNVVAVSEVTVTDGLVALLVKNVSVLLSEDSFHVPVKEPFKPALATYPPPSENVNPTADIGM